MFDADADARLERIEKDVAALLRDRTPSGGVQIYQRDEPGMSQEWMIVDPTFAPLASDSKQTGYRITSDGALARVWARQYSGVDKVPVSVSRADYIAAQEWARGRHGEWAAAIKAAVAG